jgi:transcriptional regulator with XRE-family HTH domain
MSRKKRGVRMGFDYESNEQVAQELRALLVRNKISQRELCEKMEIRPQGFTKILSKENFGFKDADRILSAAGYKMRISFEKLGK